MGGWVAERTFEQASGETSRLSGSTASPALWLSCSRVSATTLARAPKASPGSSPAARPPAPLSSAGAADEADVEVDDGEASPAFGDPFPSVQPVSSAIPQRPP